MSTDIVSYWPLVIPLPVGPGDCDANGYLTDAAVEQMFALARARYFDLCTTVDASTVVIPRSAVVRGDATVTPGGITISVGVIEVYPETFTMAARIRPADGPGVAADARCSVSPGGDVTDAMRDEFIALAHAARRTH